MRRRGESSPADKPATEIIVPHDPITEQAILAAAIVAEDDLRNKLLDRIAPECFFVDEHRAAWSVLREMKQRRLEYDPVTITRLAGDRVRASYLSELTSQRPDVPSEADLEQFIDWLMWDRRRSSVVNGPLSGLIASIKNPRESHERVRALARAIGQAFEGHNERQFIYAPKVLVSEMMHEIRQRVAGHATYPIGIPGLDCFDSGERRLIPGAAPGLVTLVTGVTGSGKSTFTAHLALGQMRQRRKVLYGAWEVNAPMTLEILTIIDLGWSRSEMLDPEGAVKKGHAITYEKLVDFEERAHAISQWVSFVKNPFRRNQEAKRSNEANLDLVQSILTDAGCHVFIADLWARCLVSRKPEEEEEALFRQQAMLEELNVHGILVHQQRYKDIEMRADKRPTREGLKGSGAYAEIADNMFGTHRPAQWKRIDDDILEIFVLKQRYGKWPLGVEFRWDGDKGSIEGGREIAYDPMSDAAEMGSGVGSTFTPPRKERVRRGQSRSS